jgi:hypothetical protein
MYVWDNTVGSSKRVNPTVLAYIAGFLDGDGCIKAKIDKQLNNIFGFRTRIIVSFSQHTRNRRVLDWIKKQLQHGTIADYPSKHMSEYTISDSKFIERLLHNVQPYVVNKSKQIELALKLLSLRDRYKKSKSFKKAWKIAQQIRASNSSPKKYS